MSFIDLHVHSTFSDGSFTPAGLVQLACEKGLYAFALTDQDSVAGIPAAMQAVMHSPMYVIAGVEITTALGGRPIHILGYGIDYENPDLVSALRMINQYRDERNVKICSQLRTYGIEIDYDTIRSSMGCHMINRNHFAGYLVQHGYTADVKESFDKYLAKGRPCYIPMRRLSTHDAVKLILRAGGIPVVAHPSLYRMDEQGFRELFSLLRSFGVRGIEAIHPSNSPEEELLFRNLARELNMCITGGSDFRGILKPDIDLGTGRGNIMVPKTLLDDLR